MEASVVVCQPLSLPRPCHPGNLPKVRKIAMKDWCAVGLFLSMWRGWWMG